MDFVDSNQSVTQSTKKEWQRGNGYIKIFDYDLTRKINETTFGGPGNLIITDIYVTHEGIYITGYTYATTFPVTITPKITHTSNYSIAFVSKLSLNLKKLLASRMLCNFDDEMATSLKVDQTGVYVASFHLWTDYFHSFYDKLTGDCEHSIAVTGFSHELGKVLTTVKFGTPYLPSWANALFLTQNKVYIAGGSNDESFKIEGGYDDQLKGLYSGFVGFYPKSILLKEH